MNHPQYEIPTEDQQAALAFCRKLKALLSNDAANAGESAPEISVVLPVHNETENLQLLHDSLTRVLDVERKNFEFIFVDDGSTDGSAALLASLAAKDARVRVIELARKFGHQVAVSAGLDHAFGKVVVVMDADLQDPPAVVPSLIAKWREGYDVVYAIRQNRKEHWLKCVAYKAFYRILSRLSSVSVPLDAGDFCCMDQRVVRILTSMPERTRFVRGLRSWVGMRQIGVPYDRDARYGGVAKYDFWRLVLLAVDGVVSLSHAPLRLVTTIGFGVSAFALVLGGYFATKKLFFDLQPPGFASTITAVFLLAGIQLITLGVVGEYVGRIFDEVKGRPLYLVRRIIGAPREHRT